MGKPSKFKVLRDIHCDRSGVMLAKKGTTVEGYLTQEGGEDTFEEKGGEWTSNFGGDHGPTSKYLQPVGGQISEAVQRVLEAVGKKNRYVLANLAAVDTGQKDINPEHDIVAIPYASEQAAKAAARALAAKGVEADYLYVSAEGTSGVVLTFDSGDRNYSAEPWPGQYKNIHDVQSDSDPIFFLTAGKPIGTKVSQTTSEHEGQPG